MQSTFEEDYELTIYRFNTRVTKLEYPDIYNFKGEITENDFLTYNIEKDHMKQLSCNNDSTLNVCLWDISFSSSYGFPNNKIGFKGQWMNNKIAPLAQYLSGISSNENVNISYLLINEDNNKSLDNIYDKIKIGDRLIYEKDCNYLSDLIEKNIFDYICPYYNQFFLKPCDMESKSVIISNYEDLKKEKQYLYNSSSHLYSDPKKFNDDYEEWQIIFNKLEKLFDTIGHDRPLWTAYLPENIDRFEEVKLLTNCGNFINILLRSEKYFYFMQYTR